MPGKVAVIAGLGNPGAAYARTRHNAGFWLVDRLAANVEIKPQARFQGQVCQVAIAGQPTWLLKPGTAMNLSGASVAAFANYYRIAAEEILVVHDELDLAPGVVRLKRGGGHGGHNGLRDVTAHLGPDFLRLRIGIGHPGVGQDVVGYVLSTPNAADRAAIEDAMARAEAELAEIVTGNVDQVMNRLNRRGDEPAAQ